MGKQGALGARLSCDAIWAQIFGGETCVHAVEGALNEVLRFDSVLVEIIAAG